MKNFQKGFTLLETVLVMGISVIVGTLLLTILVNQSNFSSKQNSLVSEGLGLNDATRKIDEYIRQAVSIVESYPEDSPIYTTSSDTLVLKLPAIDSSGVISSVFDYVVIARDLPDTNVLRLQVFPDPLSTRQSVDTVLTAILESIEFQFKDKNGNLVSLDLTTTVDTEVAVTSQNGSISSSRSSKISTTLRNASQ